MMRPNAGQENATLQRITLILPSPPSNPFKSTVSWLPHCFGVQSILPLATPTFYASIIFNVTSLWESELIIVPISHLQPITQTPEKHKTQSLNYELHQVFLSAPHIVTVYYINCLLYCT